MTVSLPTPDGPDMTIRRCSGWGRLNSNSLIHSPQTSIIIQPCQGCSIFDPAFFGWRAIMTVYQYRCLNCKRRLEIPLSYKEYGQKTVLCPLCKRDQVQRRIGRI